jgi:hypothetical protein
MTYRGIYFIRRIRKGLVTASEVVLKQWLKQW